MTRPTRSSTVRPLVTSLALALALAGCGDAATPATPAVTAVPATAAPAPTASSSPVASGGPAVSPDASAGTTPAPTEDPAAAARAALASRPWATATLTDVETNLPFTISEFAGRTVFVEAMAIWCTNCRQQQARFAEALGRLDPAKVAYVVLTIEPSENANELARYEATNGFSGTYAVAGRDVSAALEAEFGSNVLNPPTVPLVVITPSGEVSFRTGGESVDEIVATAGG